MAHRYVCMTVPKAGATTIKRTLRAFEGLAEIADHGVLHEDEEQPRLSSLTAAEAEEALGSEEWLRFAIVRNPYGRIFSAWKSKIAKHDDRQYAGLRHDMRKALGYPAAVDGVRPMVAFGDFVRFVVGSDDPQVVEDGHWDLQTNILLNDVIAYDTIGRFETFVGDFTAILGELGASGHVLEIASEVTNSTPQVPLAAAFDRDLAEVVYLYYRADFEAFGYSRDSWMFG